MQHPELRDDAERRDAVPAGMLGLLIAISAVGPFSLNILTPAMPALVRALRTDVETVQLTLSLYLIVMAVAQLILGALSDRFGRRRVLIAGLVLTTLSSFAAAAATSIDALILARSLQAFGASAGIVVSRAIIRDLYARDRAASMIGWVTMVIMVVPMVVPWFGGVLDTAFGWPSVFLCIGIVSLFVLFWVAVALPETLSVAATAGGATHYMHELRALSSSRKFLGYILCCATGSALFFAFLGGAPHVVVTQMGRSSAEFGLWFASGALAYMAGNYGSVRWSPQFGIDKMVAWGTLICFAGATLGPILVWAAPAGGPAIIFLPQAVMAFGNGLLLPNAIAGAISVRPQAAGAASGITGFLQMAVGGASAQFVSHILAPALTAMPMVVVLWAFAVACLLCYFVLIRQR